MKISELQVNQRKVDITATVKEIGTVREFNKFGKPGKVVTAVIEDDSGSIQLTLWNEQIDIVKEGDTIKIENAYVKEWQGEKQLNIGRLGKLDKV
jgi:replication factor A1